MSNNKKSLKDYYPSQARAIEQLIRQNQIELVELEEKMSIDLMFNRSDLKTLNELEIAIEERGIRNAELTNAFPYDTLIFSCYPTSGNARTVFNIKKLSWVEKVWGQSFQTEKVSDRAKFRKNVKHKPKVVSI